MFNPHISSRPKVDNTWLHVCCLWVVVFEDPITSEALSADSPLDVMLALTGFSHHSIGTACLFDEELATVGSRPEAPNSPLL